MTSRELPADPAAPVTGITLLRTPTLLRAGPWMLGPVLGAGVALLLEAVSDWLLHLPWVPFRGPLELMASVPESWATVVAVLVGAAAGLLGAGWLAYDRLSVVVSPAQAEFRWRDTRLALERDLVTGVFADQGTLVAIDGNGDELAREGASGLSRDAVRNAFEAHGWPWLDHDPHAGDFRLWVKGDLTLPPAADVLLKARAKALAKAPAGKSDAAELRRQLNRLGVVVREKGSRQFWRGTG